LGTRIGEGWVAAKDLANFDFDQYTAQQSRMYNDISTPGSNLTPADIAGQRSRDLGGALTRLGNDVYRIADSAAASGELVFSVVGTVEGGYLVRDLATGATRLLSGKSASAVSNAAKSAYSNVSRSRSVLNIASDVTKSEFITNLEKNGYARALSRDGKALILRNSAGEHYVVRDVAKSVTGPTADYYNAASKAINAKIRLKP